MNYKRSMPNFEPQATNDQLTSLDFLNYNLAMRCFAFFSILLVTLDLWAGACCCLGPCDASSAVSDGQGAAAVPACHAPAEAAYPESSAVGTLRVTDFCDCAVHRVGVRPVVLPSVKLPSLEPPVLLPAVAWSGEVQMHSQPSADSIMVPGLVTARLAPRLCVLARLII